MTDFVIFGDVSNPSGSLATTITAGVVTLAKQANLAANSVIGNPTGAGSVPVAVPLASAPTGSSVAYRDPNANIQNNNTRQGFTTTATAGTATTLTVASTFLQFFTGTFSQTVTLPDVTTLVLGHQFYIKNNSAGLVTVNSSGGNLIRVIGPNCRAIVTCLALSGVSAASWSAMYVGISIADGKVLVASNSLTLSGTDGNSLSINSVGASVSGANTGDQTITLAGAITGSGTSNLATTITAGAVTLSTMANLAGSTVLGNPTGAAATPSAVPLASLPTASAIMLRDANANGQVNNMRQGFTTTVTATATTTLTVASTYLQFFTGTLAQTVVLPDVTTLVQGQQFYIRNNSTGLVTVNSSGGGLIRVIGAGTRCVVTCTQLTGSTAASWSAMYLGINIADGKVLTVSNSITLFSTDGNSLSVNSLNASIAGTNTGDQDIQAGAMIATDSAQSGTAYTLAAGDQYKELSLTNATGCAVSIPLNATYAFPIGTRIAVWADAAGTYTIVGVSGVTLNGVSAGTRTGTMTVNLAGVRNGVVLRKIATDTWTVSGAIGAVA